MRLALLTDLHANREAVEACLAHAERQHVDQYAFTGDFVGYGADPAWVVRTVMEYVERGAVAVQGNHDVAVTRPLNPRMHAEAASWMRNNWRSWPRCLSCKHTATRASCTPARTRPSGGNT
jgi:predicted phosphodiesterase